MNDVIVVGVDGTAASAAAIRWAAQRARERECRLELLHVSDDEWGTLGSQGLDELDPRAESILDAANGIVDTIAPDVARTRAHRRGDPMVELAERSRTVAMLVIGTHKTGFFHGRALGSRSLQLAAMAHCPVAVIPAEATSFRSAIVVGVDDSPAGEAAVEFGSRESLTTAEPLVMVHAVREPVAAGGYGTSTRVDALTQRAVDVAKALGVRSPIRTRDIQRPAAEALIDAALQAKLLVIGSSRRRGAELSALGPVSHDVLMNITGPTIVVHGDMAVAAPAGDN